MYYSYFKHLASRAPTLVQGISDLKADNLTEHGNTINVFGRFNIYQELFLAILYKIQDFGLKPIMFYVTFVFSLQGLYLVVKFLIAWHLSGSWLTGVLMSAYVVCHK